MSETDVLITSTGYRYSIQTRIQSRKLPQGNTRSWSAVFILINAAMGAGLLTFPYAFFLTGGWQWGLVVQLVSYECIMCILVYLYLDTNLHYNMYSRINQSNSLLVLRASVNTEWGVVAWARKAGKRVWYHTMLSSMAVKR